MHYIIEGLGVFTFIILATLAVIPLVWTIFGFWLRTFRTIREGRAIIRKMHEAVKEMRRDAPHGEEKTHDPTA